MRYRVLIVDDEELIRKSLSSVFDDRGYAIESAADGKHALDHFARWSPHVVVLDMRLPDFDGVDLLRELRKRDSSAQIIMITAHGDISHAVQAMKLGAFDFLRKPYELEEILHAVEQAVRNLDRDRRLTLYEERNRASFSRDIIVGDCSKMKQVWETVEKAATSKSTTVLLQGESGTGKELFARAIHQLSDRSEAPLVDINCSSFQESLLENELFGHEKGAFTGATGRKRGLVELCDGGTLLLDEVGEAPLVTQAKLLRFIEDHTFRRVGGAADLSVDIRIIAATNASLEDAVERGRFRKDFFYRLKVVSIDLPPLREREDDVGALALFFLDRFSRKFKKQFTDIDPEVVESFMRYPWPGNVRELRNLIERVVLLEDAEILGVEHLPDELQAAFSGLDDGKSAAIAPEGKLGMVTLREAGDRHILEIVRACDGNRTHAAKVLGISRQHLITRLRQIEEKKVSTELTC